MVQTPSPPYVPLRSPPLNSASSYNQLILSPSYYQSMVDMDEVFDLDELLLCLTGHSAFQRAQ